MILLKIVDLLVRAETEILELPNGEAICKSLEDISNEVAKSLGVSDLA